MKGKIILFFSILLVSITAICSLTAFAYEEYYSIGTSSNFAKNYSTSVTKISSWKRVGTIQSISNDHDNRYKFIEYSAYRYNDDIQSFVFIDDNNNTGTARQLDAAVTSVDNATNVLAYGGMGYSNISNTGIEEYLTINVRKSNVVGYLPSSYLPY